MSVPTLNLIEPPALLALSLEDAKGHLKVDVGDEDADIEAMVRASIAFSERFMGRSLVDQTFDLILDAFPTNGKPLKIPRPPLIEVLGVYHNDVLVTGYAVDALSAPARLYLTGGQWPAGSAPGSVRVRFRAGYVQYAGSPAMAVGEVPFDIIAALKLQVGTLYMQRETINIGNIVNNIPWSAEQLLRQHKVDLALA